VAVLTELGGLDETGELLTTLIRHYLDETPQRMAVMQAALTSGDATILAETAHALKGASANLGAIRMQALCGELQTSGRNSDLATASVLLMRLDGEWALARKTLCQERDRLNAGSRRSPTAG
jgi:two-component system, sensor histidine kinase and response regulator